MKIGFIGDSHGQNLFVTRTLQEMAKQDVKTVVQLGDFGWWPRLYDTMFLEEVGRVVHETGIDFYFIDGNHEDHSTLDHTRTKPYVPSYEGFNDLWNNIKHWPRGAVLEFDGIKFLGFGGAGSIDKRYRTNGWDWFKEEEPGKPEVDRAIGNAGNGVDVLLTHDCTETVFNRDLYPDDDYNIGGGVRKAIQEIAAVGKPRLNIHGHHHMALTAKVELPGEAFMTSIGLDCEYMNGSSLIVDTDDPISSWGRSESDFGPFGKPGMV